MVAYFLQTIMSWIILSQFFVLNLSGVVWLSLLMAPASSGLAQVTCEGGRSEGDKWFDGCRWCVCQLDGPLCSPASCSPLVTQVPPCEDVGSSWKDGCYHCKCHMSGIDCVADRACVVLMQTDDFLSCVEPEDDRCVCGVDGTPSCTAEVIDRHAHPATTIALDTSYKNQPHQRFGYNDRESSEEIESFQPSSSGRWGARSRVKRRSGSLLDEYLRRREQRRRVFRQYRTALRGGLRSSYLKPYRFFNRMGGYYNYADADGHPNGGYHSSQEVKDRNRFRSSASSESYPQSFWKDDRLRHEAEQEDEDQDRDEDSRDNMLVNDQGREFPAPRSLLIITSNRCRYGARWYGGGLRCYCDGDGSITCGDPRFVSTRIDGFRLEKELCEEGHAWYDEGKCQVCECKFNGVVLCRRSESCPLPFLIQAVPDLPSSSSESSGDSDRASNEAGDEDEGVISGYKFNSKKTVDRRRSDLKSFSRNPMEDYPHQHRPSRFSSFSDGSDNDKTIDLSLELTGKPPVIIDRQRGRRFHPHVHRNNPSHPRTNNNHHHKQHTTVIVTECNPGSRWKDGCKRCSCDSFGRKHCSDRLCLKPTVPKFRFSQNAVSSGPPMANGRPIQRPPQYPAIRNRPVKIKSPFPKDKPCGKYKVGEQFSIKCNGCLCTPHGPKCTAMNCG